MDKITLAAKIATQLRELADHVEKAAQGDKLSQTLVASYIDGYWHGLVIGANVVEAIVSNEVEEATEE